MSLSHLEKITEYAQLIITLGVNIGKDDKLLISTGLDSYEFARLLGQVAYAKGASFVRIDVTDTYLTKAKIENASEEGLTYIPSYLASQLDTMINERWARIRIDNTSEIGTLIGLDAHRQQAFERAWSTASRPFQTAVMSNHVPWCVVCFPDENWAGNLFKTEPSRDAQLKLWNLLMPLLRLDREDPIQAWRGQMETLTHRCDVLNKKDFREVHFLDEELGTDLTLGLCEQAVWLGGGEHTQFGLPFLANIPTEEVFTAPHLGRAEGKVFVTRPVKIMETNVDGIWFEFKEGKVVNWGSKDHKELLDKFFTMDEGARHLGEVALVDKNSPIYQSGQVFSNILFDENASCHIAFGAAYPVCSKDGDKLSPEDARARGINDSLVHKDFMIGSDNLTVKGKDAEGIWHTLIEKGEFKI